MVRRFLTGMGFLAAAWGVCKRAGVRWLLFVPMLLNITFVALLWRYGLTGVLSHMLIDHLAQSTPPAYTAVLTIVSRFVDLIVFVLASYVTLRFGAVLCSPLYGALAERVALVLPGAEQLPRRSAWQDLVAAIGYEWKKLLMNGAFAFAAVLLAVIPGVGVVIDLGWSVLVGVFFVCLDYTDASFSRRGQSIRSRLKDLGQVMPEALGFALVALPLLSVPGLNLLTMPLCVAAGMLLAAEAHARAAQ